MRFAEIKRNILNIPHPEYKIVHCISADLKLGAGVAKLIAEKYPQEIKLMRQKQFESTDKTITNGEFWPKVGTAIAAPNMKHNYNVYHLVTKQRYFDKPDYYTLALSLHHLAKRCRAEKVKKLAMPMIGCGLDQLEWPRVRTLIKAIFRDEDVDIVICHKDGVPQ